MGLMQRAASRRNGTDPLGAGDDTKQEGGGTPGPVVDFSSAFRTGPADPDTLNPYLAAKREWNERYGDFIKQRDSWRRSALVSWAIAGIAVAGLAYSAGQNHIKPYIIATDKLGAPTYMGPAVAAERPGADNIRAELARWIGNVRLVTPDVELQRKAINDSYALLSQGTAALQTVGEYLHGNDPFERARRETVDIEVVSVLPLAGNTWRIEWREIVRGRDGSVTATRPMQANVVIAVSPPKDESTAFVNPMGIYVNSLSWSERL